MKKQLKNLPKQKTRIPWHAVRGLNPRHLQPSPEKGALDMPPARNLNVLLVDDEWDIIGPSISDALLQSGVAKKVDHATSIEELVKILYVAREPFDVLLLDRWLGSVDSMVYLEQLVATHPEMAIVILTADLSIEPIQAALNKGAADYAFKLPRIEATCADLVLRLPRVFYSHLVPGIDFSDRMRCLKDVDDLLFKIERRFFCRAMRFFQTITGMARFFQVPRHTLASRLARVGIEFSEHKKPFDIPIGEAIGLGYVPQKKPKKHDEPKLNAKLQAFP